jgi:protein-S-isoprenylcysteine O-methyltransferase Ste14
MHMKISHVKTLGLIAGMVLVAVLASPTTTSVIAGSIFVCIGEAVRIWAAGHLQRKKEVTTSGPYAYLRDPLYFGRLFLIIGFCVMGWGYCLIMLPVALGVFFLNYLPRKYRKEMDWLEDLFGEEYTRYAACVRSLIPRLRPYNQACQRKWSFKLLWSENREQYFLLIVLSIWAALFCRYVGF